jgi:phosphonate transport system ATP-binding protein
VKRLRVADNVLVGRLAHARGLWSGLALARIFSANDRGLPLRCLAHVGLLDRAWQRTDTLSGGEQQRVAIARLLAQAPALVLADEPMASLDLLNGALVMETLRGIATESGLTVISTLHHVEYARRYADRVLGLRDGRLVFDGAPTDLTDVALVAIFGELPAPPTGVGEERAPLGPASRRCSREYALARRARTCGTLSMVMGVDVFSARVRRAVI